MEIIIQYPYLVYGPILILVTWYFFSGRAEEDRKARLTRNLYCFDRPVIIKDKLENQKVLFDDFKGLVVFTPRSKDKYVRKVERQKVDKDIDYQRFLIFRQWHIDKLSSYFSTTPPQISNLLITQITLLDEILFSLDPKHKNWIETNENVEEVSYDIKSDKPKKPATEVLDYKAYLNNLFKGGLSCEKLLDNCLVDDKFKWGNSSPCKDLGHLIYFLWKNDLFAYDQKKDPNADRFIKLFDLPCTTRAVTSYMMSCPEELQLQFENIFRSFLEVKN